MTVVAWKSIGAIVAAASIGALGFLVSGRAPAKAAEPAAPPTISAPALTTADLEGVRGDLREFRKETQTELREVNRRLGNLEGAQEERRSSHAR